MSSPSPDSTPPSAIARRRARSSISSRGAAAVHCRPCLSLLRCSRASALPLGHHPHIPALKPMWLADLSSFPSSEEARHRVRVSCRSFYMSSAPSQSILWIIRDKRIIILLSRRCSTQCCG